MLPVSESFKKAWDYRDRMDTPRHLENFLYFVTRNACISRLWSDREYDQDSAS